MNTNMSSCAFFGYTKTELINRKLNTLMPSIFSVHHDSFLENYLNNNELTALKDERYFFTFSKKFIIIILLFYLFLVYFIFLLFLFCYIIYIY
jgi:hypothetical protein